MVIRDREGSIGFAVSVLSNNGRNPLGVKRGGNQEQYEDTSLSYQISCHCPKSGAAAFSAEQPLQSLGCWLVGLGRDQECTRVVTRRRSKIRVQAQCNCVGMCSGCVPRH